MSEDDKGVEKSLPDETPRLSGTVVALGFVSLFTDMASEMVYTQVPLFLTIVIGAPKTVVGLIEGIAESTASLLRLVSGAMSDRSGRRKPLTVLGYSLGAISKPLMALATTWPAVLALRFLDRTGKGLRTAPRDALIAENTAPSIRGRAFGLHRSMDTIGAVLGPLIGAWFLSRLPGDITRVDVLGNHYRLLFLLAGVPGLLAVLTLLLSVREKREGAQTGQAAAKDTTILPVRRVSLPRWRDLPESYRRFLLITMLFNLGNSSDVFLILRARTVGFQPVEILWLYATFNMVEAALGYGAGILSDRVGRRPLIIAGYAAFGLVYLGFALASSKAAIWLLFLLYGGYYTLTAGTQRAYAADLADPGEKAAQIGIYHTVVGLALLPASVLAGALFDWRPAAPFMVGAVIGVVSAVLMAAELRRSP